MQGKESFFYISVKPNSAQNSVLLSVDNRIEVRVTAQPIDGKANKAVIETLSNALKLPKSRFLIDKGEGSKLKKIVVKDVSNDELAEIIKKNIRAK